MLVVQIPLPRKGTETEYITRGGNGCWFKFHYPARGRKLVQSLADASALACSNSITPQGDGNLFHNCTYLSNTPFKFHYPARGRKPNIEVQHHVASVFKFHYPASGTKDVSPLSYIRPSSLSLLSPLLLFKSLPPLPSHRLPYPQRYPLYHQRLM